jgi:hypothetical protein
MNRTAPAELYISAHGSRAGKSGRCFLRTSNEEAPDHVLLKNLVLRRYDPEMLLLGASTGPIWRSYEAVARGHLSVGVDRR